MRRNIKKIDREFLDIEDSFIDLANKHCNSGDYEKISIAFLHAAARFNAFEVWASAADIAEFKSEKNTEQKYFEAIYKKRLAEELNEFETNFDKYRKELAI
jgi:hypothetical protein